MKSSLTARGFRGRGGGRAAYVEAAPEWRGTSNQVCGLWPFSAGSGSPAIGVPLGRDLFTNAPVCSDPHNWFTAGILSAPTLLIVGRPGLGKSSLLTRLALGLSAQGIIPAFLGDLKGEHVALVEALGGSSVALGRGRGSLNLIDQGAVAAAAEMLTGQARRQLLADSLGRRLNMIGACVELNRRAAISDGEEAVLVAALRVLDEAHKPGDAVLSDLIAVLDEGPDPLRTVTLARQSERRYRNAVDPLQTSLMALCDGALGDVLAKKSTVSIDLTRPVVFDVSSVGEEDTKLAAAALMVCWSVGFAAIDARHALADAGKEPPANFFAVCDEMWRLIEAGPHMARRIGAATRLNRQTGTSLAMATHHVSDVSAGLAERASYVAAFGVPTADLAALEGIVGLSQKERDLLTGWATPGTLNPAGGAGSEPPGLGKCLLKVAQRPGIALKIELTAAERALHDTNKRWEMQP